MAVTRTRSVSISALSAIPAHTPPITAFCGSRYQFFSNERSFDNGRSAPYERIVRGEAYSKFCVQFMRTSLGEHEQIDREELEDRASEHPQVKDRMHVLLLFRAGIEHRPDRVADAAHHEQPESNRVEQRTRAPGCIRTDHCPSLHEIEQGRDPARAIHPERFGNDTGKRNDPHEDAERNCRCC